MTQAEKIKAERIKAGFSQETLAEALEVSRQAVTSWETGQSAPSSANLQKLVHVLEVEVSALLADATQQPRKSRAWLIAGSIVAGVGLVGEFVIWLLSTTYPFIIISGTEPIQSITSYTKYVSHFHLEAVVTCLWVLAAVGAALLGVGFHLCRRK